LARPDRPESRSGAGVPDRDNGRRRRGSAGVKKTLPPVHVVDHWGWSAGPLTPVFAGRASRRKLSVIGARRARTRNDARGGLRPGQALGADCSARSRSASVAPARAGCVWGCVKPKQLLEVLLRERGRLVTRERVGELLWGERPPQRLAATVELCVGAAPRAASGEPGRDGDMRLPAACGARRRRRRSLRRVAAQGGRYRRPEAACRGEQRRP
jgi:hypothetical protein